MGSAIPFGIERRYAKQRLVELAPAIQPCRRRPGTSASLIHFPVPEVPQNGVASRWSRVTDRRVRGMPNAGQSAETLTAASAPEYRI
jgi:hypothetical protein